MTESSDAQLVRRFQNGDMQAFESLVQRFQDRVYRIALVWLVDAQLAPDATQEVFCRAFKGLRGFRFRASPFTWIYGATKNVCREFNRSKRPEPLLDEPLDGSLEAVEKIARKETAQQVRTLVAGLPRRQREVVLLRVFEELSVTATAQAMRCREGTVKALLHKAMQHLRLDAASMELR